MCSQIEAELGTSRSTRTSGSIRTNWQERIIRREESWEEIRPLIFEEMISKEGYPQVNECILCGSEKAVIKCVECFGTSSLLCVSCDGHVHTNAPLHDRQVWVGTHFVAVSPTTSFNQETKELMTVERLWPLRLFRSCP